MQLKIDTVSCAPKFFGGNALHLPNINAHEWRVRCYIVKNVFLSGTFFNDVLEKIDHARVGVLWEHLPEYFQGTTPCMATRVVVVVALHNDESAREYFDDTVHQINAMLETLHNAERFAQALRYRVDKEV